MGSTKVKEVISIEQTLAAPAEEKVVEVKAKAKKAKKTPKRGEPKYRSKKYLEAKEKVDRSKLYPLNEAVALVKEVSYTKFPGSIEAHILTSVKGIRGLVNLPYMSGKKLKILVFGEGAENSGADMIGTDDKLEEIIKGKIDFDVVISTPAWMSKLARAAKVLGPKGLMPNPKNGTVTNDLKRAVEEVSTGKFEYKSEAKLPVVHVRVGKLDQSDEQLLANIKALMQSIGKSKISKVKLAPSMGPAVGLDVSTAL